MTRIYLLLVVLVIAYIIFLYTLRAESFDDDPGYAKYVSGLVMSGTPFGRVFTKEAYNLFQKKQQSDMVLSTLEKLD